MILNTCVCLKKIEVRSEYTDSSAGSLVISLVIGPTWRHEIEKRDGSSAKPRLPLIPPVRAWLTWQATPDTRGSSNTLMQTLSSAPSRRNVVLRHAKSSACALRPVPARTATIGRALRGTCIGFLQNGGNYRLNARSKSVARCSTHW